MSRGAAFTLQKHERLKSRKTIEWIFTKGHKIRSQGLLAIYWVENSGDRVGGLKFGVGVSSKKIKKSVSRNKIKRLIREAYRINNQLLKQSVGNRQSDLWVFFIYTSKELLSYKIIEEQIKNLLEQLNRIIIETDT